MKIKRNSRESDGKELHFKKGEVYAIKEYKTEGGFVNILVEDDQTDQLWFPISPWLTKYFTIELASD